MIEIKNLSKTYKTGKVEVNALVNFSNIIQSDEVVTIMGRSGGGKTTLLRQIGLLDTPTSGSIEIDGQEVTKIKESQRSQLRLSLIGYIFQDYALLPELTALENVYLPSIALNGGGKAKLDRAKILLKEVGLGDRADHLPLMMSGGEQQRVAIARSLINEPKLLLADEATANLDTVTAKGIMETFVQVNKKMGCTVIFISHEPEDKQYADRVIYLRDGKMVDSYL
jgi:putative ABC transport system ATP-binding protein